MNTFAKFIASIAALIAALALAWIAWHGVSVTVNATLENAGFGMGSRGSVFRISHE
jgi:hypothetical protein